MLIGDGVKTVTTAGTDVVLAASTKVSWVIIQAQTDNTGVIGVGATGVDATVATGDGICLAAGESVAFPCDDLAEIFIDGVRYVYGLDD
jgi:2-succinyl-5-enolpyruvyl-6-hydroxy-3-cyclohexene-1-carboxylate synthase